MKKGEKIKKVIIDKGFVTAYDSSGNPIKLTRGERSALSATRDDKYYDNIYKTFGSKNVLDVGFTLIKNGSVKIS